MKRHLLFAFASLLIAAACTPIPPAAAPLTSGVDAGGMDKAIAPGDDFYAYANGGWLKATEIPPDKSRYGIFAIMADKTRERVVALIQEAAKADASASADAKKVGDFYAGFMDEAGIESKGIAPLKPQFDAIAAITDKRSLARVIGGTLRADVDPLNATNFQTDHLLGVWISQGLMAPSQSYPYLLQGGLGLPDRDYYVSKDSHMAEMRKLYQQHIAAVFKLAGFDNPDARAARVFALETKMAGVHATRVESADVKLPVSWKREELAAKAPGLDWPVLLEAAGIQDAPTFIIWHPKAVTGLSTLVAREPLDAWKDWLAFHAVDRVSDFLPKAFVDEQFAFYGKALNETPQLRERWQRATDYTSGALGEVVGKLYVERYFPAEAKAKIQAMVDDLVKAFGARVDSLAWMSPETKIKAKEKLGTLKVGVGYPDKWQDYSSLDIVKGDALGNLERASLFDYKQQLAKLHQHV